MSTCPLPFWERWCEPAPPISGWRAHTTSPTRPLWSPGSRLISSRSSSVVANRRLALWLHLCATRSTQSCWPSRRASGYGLAFASTDRCVTARTCWRTRPACRTRWWRGSYGRPQRIRNRRRAGLRSARPGRSCRSMAGPPDSGSPFERWPRHVCGARSTSGGSHTWMRSTSKPRTAATGSWAWPSAMRGCVTWSPAPRRGWPRRSCSCGSCAVTPGPSRGLRRGPRSRQAA